MLVQDEKRKATMRRRRTNTAGEERWFLAPTSHMNAFQVRPSPHMQQGPGPAPPNTQHIKHLPGPVSRGLPLTLFKPTQATISLQKQRAHMQST